MTSIFHHKHLKKSRDDFTAMLIYFVLFFVFFLIFPLGLVLLGGTHFPVFLKQVGLTTGKIEIGWILVALSIPVSIVVGLLGSEDPKIKDQYPFSKRACKSLFSFLTYELVYFFLYYFTWEFVFRGILFFTLLQSFDLIIALSIQTIISTLFHIGHPYSEIFGALIAGFIFGLVAYFTESFIYTFLIHGFIGISTDSFLYWRYYRKKA
jgi:membrane protease YdiL (CAAX protease family)